MVEKRTYKDHKTWTKYWMDKDPSVVNELIIEEYITSQGKAIHLDIYSQEKGSYKAIIIFIHGTAVYSRFYSEFLYTLHQKGYLIIAPDMPGHGLSEGRRGHFSMEELTATMRDVTTHAIENYGDKIVVMGSSLGGITTLYSVANDDRIKAAICHNAAILNEGAHKKIVKVKGVYKLLKPGVPFFAKIMPKLSISVWIYLDPHRMVKDKKWLERMDLLVEDEILSEKYTLKALATQMKAPLARPADTIETPIMILNGDDDVLFSVEYMQEIMDKLKSSRNKKLEIISNSSHLILHEFRDDCISKIIAWLNEVL